MSGGNLRPSTISDIARLSGVSNRTVSRVINRSSKVGEATREKVQQVIDELSYRPNAQARGLAGRRSYLLGLIYDNPDALIVDAAQRGVLNVCRELGYELVIHPCGESDTLCSEVVGSVKRSNLDGVIVLPPLSEDHELAGALARSVCRELEGPAAPQGRRPRQIDWCLQFWHRSFTTHHRRVR